MARARLNNELTTTIVARELGMTNQQLRRWIDREVLPSPTRVDGNGCRYFNNDWLKEAKKIVRQRRGDNGD